MIKRGAIIGIGTALLIVGLTGLGLLQTGVIFPQALTGPLNLPEVKPPEPAAESSQKSQGLASGSEQQAGAAGSGAELGRRSGRPAQSGVTPSGSPGQVSANGTQQPPARRAAVEKTVPVPQVGKGERRYPTQQSVSPPSRLAQPAAKPKSTGTATRKSRFDEKRVQPQLQSESRRYAGKSGSKRNAGKTFSAGAARDASAGPVVIRFNFDPAQSRRLNVAHVHLGDKIRVNVKRVGQVDRRVYFTFSKNINSPQGAVLELETMYSFEHPVSNRRDRGYFVVEVKIFPGNRWNILPRSYV